jgi:hypothetical protein
MNDCIVTGREPRSDRAASRVRPPNRVPRRDDENDVARFGAERGGVLGSRPLRHGGCDMGGKGIVDIGL